jgi:hypothetical protein
MAAPEEQVRWVHDTFAMVLPYMAPDLGGESEDARLSRLAFQHGAGLERETTLQDLVEEYLVDHPELDAATARIVRRLTDGAIDSLGFLNFSAYEREFKGRTIRGHEAFCSLMNIEPSSLESALDALKAMPVGSDNPHGGVGCADMFDYLRYRFLHCSKQVSEALSPCARAILDSAIAIQLLGQSPEKPELGFKQVATVLNSNSQTVQAALRELISVFPPPTRHLSTPLRTTYVSKPTLTIGECKEAAHNEFHIDYAASTKVHSPSAG